MFVFGQFIFSLEFIFQFVFFFSFFAFVIFVFSYSCLDSLYSSFELHLPFVFYVCAFSVFSLLHFETALLLFL